MILKQKHPTESKFEESPPKSKVPYQIKTTPGINDALLADFGEEQREFIIKELYPSLKQCLI